MSDRNAELCPHFSYASAVWNMFSKHQVLSACTWIPSHQKPQLHLHLKPVGILQPCWGPLRTGMPPFWPHTARHVVQTFLVACGTLELRQDFELGQMPPSGKNDIQLPYFGKYISPNNRLVLKYQKCKSILQDLLESFVEKNFCILLKLLVC